MLALASGACALAYEALYLRALTVALGDRFEVHAALLATFLVGIGLGAGWAHHCRRQLPLLELGTGLYAWCLPLLRDWFAGSALATLATSHMLVSAIVAAALVAPGALLIGFSLPLFSDWLKRASGANLAFRPIYLVYNLGGLLGLLSVEFLLIRHFGIRQSLWLAGTVNFIVAAGLWLNRCPPLPMGNGGLASSAEPLPRSFSWREYAAVMLGGLASAIFQIFLLKLSFLVFGPHRENFSLAVATTMSGLALGTWLTTRYRLGLATVLALIPVLVGGIFLAWMPLLQSCLWAAEGVAWSWPLSVVVRLAGVAVFGLAPLTLFGALLPAVMNREQAVARESGRLVLLASLANAAGYLAFVFLVHPWLSGGQALVLVALLALGGAALAAPRYSRGGIAGALAGLVLAGLLLWRWQDRHFHLAQWADRVAPEDQVLIFKASAESATLLRNEQYEWITYNGHPSVQVTVRDEAGNRLPNHAEIASGIVPALVAPRLERALVLGCGTGMTGGTAAQFFAHTDIVEINPAFLQMLPELRHANFAVAENPAARIHLADGRTFLTAHHGEYDVIVNSIPEPTYFSAGKIYTVEFYQRVAAALRPDGVFCTWLSPSEMTGDGVKLVLAAIRREFPHAELRLLTGAYYFLSCSRQPLRPRPFGELPERPAVGAVFAMRFPDWTPEQYFAATLLSPEVFERPLPTVTGANTDDLPRLEFMLAPGAYRLRATTGNDLFVNQPGRFGIDPIRGLAEGDLPGLIRLAGLHCYLRTGFFLKNFVPRIAADEQAMAAWDEWYAKATGHAAGAE